jgi:hypothetical protein
VHVIGPIDLVAPRVPLIQIDAPEVHRPQQRRKILHDRKIDNPFRAVIDRNGFDPFRSRRGRALHEEEIARRPVRISLHHHRAIGEMRHEDGRHLGVIGEQVPFGSFRPRPKGFPQIGQLDATPVHLDDDVVGIGREEVRPRHG